MRLFLNENQKHAVDDTDNLLTDINKQNRQNVLV